MKFFKIIYYTAFAFIALVALLLIISVFPITGNIKFLTVLSGSMEPAIKTGSVVLVGPAREYKIGDVITFGPTGRNIEPTTHRIKELKVEDGQVIYITKGDANNAQDGREIRKPDIMGKVYVTVPYLGYALAAIRKPTGFAVLIIIPAAIIIYDEIRKIIKEVKNAKKKKEEQKEI